MQYRCYSHSIHACNVSNHEQQLCILSSRLPSERVVLSLPHANSFSTEARVNVTRKKIKSQKFKDWLQIRWFLLCWWNGLNFDINSGDSKDVAGSPHHQRVLQPSTDLSVVRHYETGDLGLVPRANEQLCTRVDTMRWLSASLNYQMVGRVITRSVATQTPESLSEPRRHHHIIISP